MLKQKNNWPKKLTALEAELKAVKDYKKTAVKDEKKK